MSFRTLFVAGSEKNSVEFRSDHGSNGFQTCASRGGCCRGCRLTRTGRRTHACPPHARAAPRGRHVPRMRRATRAPTHPCPLAHSPTPQPTHPPTYPHPPTPTRPPSDTRIPSTGAISVGGCVNVCTCVREGANAHQGTRRADAHEVSQHPTHSSHVHRITRARAPASARARTHTSMQPQIASQRQTERERERESRGRCSHTHTHTHTHRPRDGSCGAAEVTEEGHSRLNCFRSRGCSELFMLLEQRAAAGEKGGGVRGSLVYVHYRT